MRRPTAPGWTEKQTPTPFLYHKLDLKPIITAEFGVSIWHNTKNMYNSDIPAKYPSDDCKFQAFTPFTKASSVFVSEELIKELENNDDNCVHKYLHIDYFIDSIINHYFYMASPSKWDDPFELKYLDFLNEPRMGVLQQMGLEELKSMSIFCSCMTFNDSDSEEASWKSYGDNKEEIIRVSYNFKTFCNILSKTNEEIYIGKMEYKTRKEIVNPTMITKRERTTLPQLKVLYVNNFALNRKLTNMKKNYAFVK